MGRQLTFSGTALKIVMVELKKVVAAAILFPMAVLEEGPLESSFPLLPSFLLAILQSPEQ